MNIKNNTSKLILIDKLNNEVILFSSKGALADHLTISRETIVNWLRDSNKANKENYIIYKVDREIYKSYPGRPDRKGVF